jgi:hypothetical protein
LVVTFFEKCHLNDVKQKITDTKGDFEMKSNESSMDRIIRVVVGIVLAALYFLNVLSGTMGIVLLVVGIILVLTGIVGFCPLYALLKIKTNKS